MLYRKVSYRYSNLNYKLRKIPTVRSKAAGLVVSATTDNLTLTENASTLDFALTVQGTTYSLTITENQATVSTALLIATETDSLVITENDATLDFSLTVSTVTDSLVITENAATVQLGAAIVTSTDSLLLIENAAVLDFVLSVTTDTDTLTITENDATVSFEIVITTETDSLVITENDANIDLQLTVITDTDSLVITENDTTVTTSAAITTVLDTLSITENDTTLDFQLTVTGTTQDLTLTEFDSTVFTTDGQYILCLSSTVSAVPMVAVFARTGDNMYVLRHVEDGGTEEIIQTGVVASGVDILSLDVTTDNPALYIDGALVATSSLSMASTTVSFHGVGALIQSSVSSYMTGRIWDVTATDPNDGTNSRFFPVDEGTGSTLTDTLNSNTATVVNFDADMWV